MHSQFYLAQNGLKLAALKQLGRFVALRLDRSAYGELSVRLAVKVPTPVLHKIFEN